MHAARAVAGTCASQAALAYVRKRSVHPEVLLSNLGILPTRHMWRLAYVRTGRMPTPDRNTQLGLGNPMSD